MQRYEYKVIATPRKVKRVRKVKGPQARFAHLLTETMNELAVDGWEYLRAENLPIDESQGVFKGSIETYQSVMVFRRALAVAVPEVVAPVAVDVVEDVEDVVTEPEAATEPTAEEVIEAISPGTVDEFEIAESEAPADPLVKMAEENAR